MLAYGPFLLAVVLFGVVRRVFSQVFSSSRDRVSGAYRPH